MKKYTELYWMCKCGSLHYTDDTYCFDCHQDIEESDKLSSKSLLKHLSGLEETVLAEIEEAKELLTRVRYAKKAVEKE